MSMPDRRAHGTPAGRTATGAHTRRARHRPTHTAVRRRVLSMLRAARRVSPRWRWVATLIAVLAVAGILVAVLWPSSGSIYDPPARARQYIAFSACLLTGPAGLTDAAAGPVWSGMQQASVSTRAKITHLAVVGAAETVGSVTPFANTLVQQHCGLVLAVGTVEVQAAQAVAASNTAVDFVLVGAGSAGGNVAVVPTGKDAQVSSRVASLVEGTVHGYFHPGVVS